MLVSWLTNQVATVTQQLKQVMLSIGSNHLGGLVLTHLLSYTLKGLNTSGFSLENK